MGLGALAMNTIPRAQHGAGSRLLPGGGGRGGWRATGVWQWARKQGAAGVTRAGHRKGPRRASDWASGGLRSGGSSEPQRACHAFPSLHLCRHRRPQPPSPSGASPDCSPRASLARGAQWPLPWSLRAGVARPAASPDDRCLSPLPPTPGCSRVRSLQGPPPWAALPLRLMGIVPRVRQMLQPLSGCCLPGWSVCTGVVALLTRLPGPPAPEPARSSCPRSVPDLPP